MRRLLIASLLAGLLTPLGNAVAAECAAAPKTPTAPLGCKAMLPTCVCDASGNCHWDYICDRE